MKPAIEIDHLGKAYKLKGKPFWALRDISCTINPGEVMGIIGRNGAGKTTLLRVLSRITEPSKGRAVVRGRIGSLLETGTGFHEDLSGRENVFLNGAILGMRPQEIRRKFTDIVDFSGVGRFIDSAVKSYSSGMRSRLAFSIAAHLDTEILLVDEVLAVGDLAFQEKCLRKMDQLTSSHERTVLFVSHSMGAVQSLCTRALLIENGEVSVDGKVADVVRAYHTLMLGPDGNADLKSGAGRPGSGEVRIVGMHLEDLNGNKVEGVPAGSGVRICLHYENRLEQRPEEVIVTAVIVGSRGVRLFGAPSDVVRADLSQLDSEGEFVCSFPSFPLLPGHYELVVSVLVDRNLTDKITKQCHIIVDDSDFFGTGRMPAAQFGDVVTRFQWHLE